MSSSNTNPFKLPCLHPKRNCTFVPKGTHQQTKYVKLTTKILNLPDLRCVSKTLK